MMAPSIWAAPVIMFLMSGMDAVSRAVVREDATDSRHVLDSQYGRNVYSQFHTRRVSS